MTYQQRAKAYATTLQRVLNLPGVRQMCAASAKDGKPAFILAENDAGDFEMLSVRIFPFHHPDKTPSGLRCQEFAQSNPEKATALLYDGVARIADDADRAPDKERYHFGRDRRDNFEVVIGGQPILLHLALDVFEGDRPNELTLCAFSER